MLLLETPQGPRGRQRGWNMTLGELSALSRHAASCPATPQNRASPGGEPHTREEAFPLTCAPPGHPKGDTWRGAKARRQLFERAAALADSLEHLRLQVQTSLAQPGQLAASSNHAGACSASRLLHTINEAQDDCASMGRASAASSVAPRHTSSDEDIQDDRRAVRARLAAAVRPTPVGLLKGISAPLQRQASPDASTGASAVASAAPDLSSRPPRLQKLAQVCWQLAHRFAENCC